MNWALIELPNPNSAEAKYKSQIPTPNNLLQTASALMEAGNNVTIHNFFRERFPDYIEADAYVFDFFPATCMDYYANYALSYLDTYRIWATNKTVWLTGFYPWLHRNEMSYPIAPPKNFEQVIADLPYDKDFYNAWDLFDFDSIPRYTDGHNRITIRASRGCPHHCSMCPVFLSHGSGTTKRHSVKWVLNEIEDLRNRGIWDIGFLDDNLFSDWEWAYILLEEMRLRAYKKKGLRFTFEEGLDVPTANNERIVKGIKDAGFYHIKLGVETFQEETLRAIGKPYREAAHAISAIKLLQSYKLSPTCFQMIGLPTQTRLSITQDTRMFASLGVKVRAQILWEYPGISVHPTLEVEELKELCQNALAETGSLTWKKKEVKGKK